MAGPGGGLTVAGVDKLTTEINGKRSSPEGEAESKMKAGALAYAKHQLSFEADYGTFKIPDPKGQDAFNVGFLPAFYQAYDAGIKAGKSPSQLLSKDSPDFIVDKVMQPFKRSPAERLKDQLDAGLEPTAGDKGAAAALAKPPAIALPALGEERDGYKFKGGNPALQASWEKIPQAPLVGAR
jgi:hypothetical protein